MEEEACRKRSSKAPFRHWKPKPTTPSVNGRSGWLSESASWLPISIPGSRQSARRLLKTLVRNLRSSAAIQMWIKEESDV